MALTKQTVISQISFDEVGILSVRTTVRVLDDDGSTLGEKYNRTVYPPNTPLADVPTARLRQHCQIEWTPAVIAAYIAQLAKQVQIGAIIP